MLLILSPFTSLFALRVSITIFLIFSIFAVRSDGSDFIRLPSSDHPCGGGESESESEKPPLSCPVKCFRTDPVCGVDGVTYWCGCEEARCAGAEVAKLGFCEVRNNGGAAAQALLLLHILWLIVLGFSVLFGLF